MVIRRIFNNNVILAETENHEKRMLLGKGIGFNRKVNQTISRDDASEIYVLEPTLSLKNVEDLVDNVPEEYLILTSRIIEMAQKGLQVRLNNAIYIGLADHISYAVTRAQQGEFLSNAMLWEIKKFYPEEFRVAQKAVDMIKASTGVALDENEAGFIAMHFVNGQQSGKSAAYAKAVMRTLQDIMAIVKNHFGIEIAEDSFNYTRFITHVRFLLQRAQGNQQEQSQDDDSLYEQVKRKYPETYQCAKKIKLYLMDNLQIDMTNDEMFYMMLHIYRLNQRGKESSD